MARGPLITHPVIPAKLVPAVSGTGGRVLGPGVMSPSEDAHATTPDATTGVAAKDEWAHLAFCPNCGTRLYLLKCKARCPRCNFFQDCSDTIV